MRDFPFALLTFAVILSPTFSANVTELVVDVQDMAEFHSGQKRIMEPLFTRNSMLSRYFLSADDRLLVIQEQLNVDDIKVMSKLVSSVHAHVSSSNTLDDLISLDAEGSITHSHNFSPLEISSVGCFDVVIDSWAFQNAMIEKNWTRTAKLDFFARMRRLTCDHGE